MARDAARLFTGVAAPLLCAACVSVATTGPFRDVEAAERELRRGTATRMDVERLLGPPQGRGEALLPGQSGDAREVWFYQSLQIGQRTRLGPADEKWPARQQTVLVFLDGERFDGLVVWPTEGRLSPRPPGWIR